MDSTIRSTADGGARRVERSAIAALAPLITVVPVSMIALAAFWWPLQLVWDIPYLLFVAGYLAASILLFVRPVQVTVLMRLLGARQPTREERARLDTAWRSVLQAAHLPDRRYVLAVLPSDELNAYACGGHLVVVTTFALETLPRDELAGVLAHELSHHLGLHTAALTVTHWLSIPVLLLAQVGFFLQNVAAAATSTFAQDSPSFTAIGKLVSGVLTGVSWIFLSGLLVSNSVGNIAGRSSELQADERAVNLGFGRELSNALRRFASHGGGERPKTFRERLSATHPPAITRVAKIEARRRALQQAAG